MTADQDMSARLADQMTRLAKEKSPRTMEEAILDVMDGACGDAYRSGQLITIADHLAAVQAAVAKADAHLSDVLLTLTMQHAEAVKDAVAKAVEAERERVKAAEWEEPDHTTMAHMLGMSAAELSVDLCRLGLFPAVGVDDTGEFCLGPFWLKDGTVIHGCASVHWSAEDKHYYWSAYIDFGTEKIRGHWPIDTIPDELAAAIRSRGVAG